MPSACDTRDLFLSFSSFSLNTTRVVVGWGLGVYRCLNPEKDDIEFDRGSLYTSNLISHGCMHGNRPKKGLVASRSIPFRRERNR